jgi:predicted nucleic acid-binding protein
MIVDTDILIDYFHGSVHATEFVRGALLRGDVLIISIATVSELLAGMRPGEEDDTNALLSLFSIYPADESLARVAGAFLNQYGRQHRLDLGDALEATPAQVTGSTLYTRNLRHYPMAEITVQAPYERGR